MKKEIIKVKGMHCSSCGELIKDALEELEGVKTVSVSHEQGIVSVEFDESSVSNERIRKEIVNEGYVVE